jgi:hypothetical protein
MNSHYAARNEAAQAAAVAFAVVGEGALALPPFGPLAFAVAHFNPPLISPGAHLIFLIIKKSNTI